MRGQLHGLPSQCRAAWHKATGFRLPPGYTEADRIVVLGVGGSAIGADLVRSLTLSKTKPAIHVHRDYDLPAFVDDRTLVIASSYSGNTEETLSSFSQALQKGCKRLVITTGGRLKAMAEESGTPVFTIDHVSPPRAALGWGFMPLLAFLQSLGFLEDESGQAEAMLATLDRQALELGETAFSSANQAKQLAKELHRKIAVVYGAGILGEVARRWKTQINENAKAWAFHEILPELNHNAVEGYAFPPELASNACVILLRCPSLHRRTLARYDITVELLKQSGISHKTVDSRGEGELGQMMSLAYLGDWVSYYLAMLYQVDPTPVESIEHLKKRLGANTGTIAF